ncbi:hypothetical protein V6N13_108991 [Hibiscus sabdariffa]
MGNPRLGTTLELLLKEVHDNPMLTTTIKKLPPNDCLGCPYSAATLKLSPTEGSDNRKSTVASIELPPIEELDRPGHGRGNYPLTISNAFTGTANTIIFSCKALCESVGDSERVVFTSMAWNNWFHNIMNPKEFKSGDRSTNVLSYMGLTHYNPYVEPGWSSVAHCTIMTSSSIDGNSSVVA